MKVEIPNQLLVKVSGMISRGIKEAEINEEGILIFTLTDGTKIELGSVKGDQGPRGESGVYVGTGEMPEGCNVQIDPSGEAFEFIQPPKTASIGQALLVKSIDETGKPTEWETGEVTGGTGGTSDHRKLSNRDAADQHPIGAITGLEEALANKQPTDAFIVTLTQDDEGTYSVDKTFAEITAAIQSGMTMYLYYQNTYYPLVYYSHESYVIFGFFGVNSTAVSSAVFAVFNDDHVEAQQKSLRKLPNPNALTFTGAVTGSYDGSAPLSVEIPSGGGGSDWELIAEITSDGTGTNSGLVAPISLNSYKELHMEATSIADSSITFRLLLSKTTNWYDGQVITSSAATNAVAYMAHFWIMDGYIKIISGRNSGYSDNQNNGTCTFTNSPRNAYLASDYDYIRFDANNSVVPKGATLKIWGVK